MVQSIDPRRAHELISGGEVEVIDVRDAAELVAGSLPGARAVPLAELRADPNRVLQRDSVLFVCAAGVRSQVAAQLAASLGLKNAYSLKGGVRGWTRAGFLLAGEERLAMTA